MLLKSVGSSCNCERVSTSVCRLEQSSSIRFSLPAQGDFLFCPDYRNSHPLSLIIHSFLQQFLLNWLSSLGLGGEGKSC